MGKTKIVLDADVIIHFSRGEMLGILPNIFREYEFIVLDVVYKELRDPIKSQLDNQISMLKNISKATFNPKGEELKEYALLTKLRGRGESACLTFCRFNHDVVGSSNLKDIADYCTKHSITYLTTLDFLYHAIRKKLITTKEANAFIKQVVENGSKLPEVNMATFVSKALTTNFHAHFAEGEKGVL